MSFVFDYPFSIGPAYSKPVAYFCMEYAIHQPLKLYAGGLGFLAGSHMRSAFELKQHMVGIGILWKYGYYDQIRKSDRTMDVLFQEKMYGCLINTGIKFKISISKHDVTVIAWYLPPEVFNTAPLFFLSTDTEENDYLAKTISHKLYDSNPETKIAAAILLGEGGAKLLEVIGWQPKIYHLNESHGLPVAFHLYRKYKSVEEVKKRLVFTNHTPEFSGNQQAEMSLLDRMDFFCGTPIDEVKKITQIQDNVLDHTLSALRLSGIANGVSKLHCKTLHTMWDSFPGICSIVPITNAQNFNYWSDIEMYKALWNNDEDDLRYRKRQGKRLLFEEVADQTGEVYNTSVFTLVFAKRFAGYKRAELLLSNIDRFHKLVTNKDRPVQIIWAGKPYPTDYSSIASFDRIVNICKAYPNCSILVGYEMKLSRLLKQGADVWLNVPRFTHEASGTSGMSAAMNGAVNVAIADGWFPEFARDKVNSFIIPAANPDLPDHQQDEEDTNSLYDVLEKEVIPLYYDHPSRWLSLIKQSMQDIIPYFDSNRMAAEYYQTLYNKREIPE